MTKVLITGASGFVGSNLSQFFKTKNWETNSLSLRNKDWSNNIPANVQAIVHLAGKAHDLKNTANDSEYYEANFELTKELYNQFLKSDAEKFIYISSVKAVADTVVGSLSEDTIPNPITVYGKSKRMAEEYILANLPSIKKVYILRPCMIHGPGNKGNLNTLFGLVSKGFPWPLGAFENKRSFCSVENLCFVIKELLDQKDVQSGVYNVADDEVLSTNELIVIVNKVLGKKVKLWKISKQLIEKTAALGDKLGLPLNSERLKKLTESYVVSNEKIKTALGIEKLPLSAEEGFIKTIQSFKKEK